MNRQVILLGNPNVGKSSIFNKITGENQHIGNWTGKTVDCAEGKLLADRTVDVVDLPGIYTLSSATAEELYSKNYLLSHKNALVMIVVDVNCICKSINLIKETLNITGNVILCLNQYKSATKSGVKVDLDSIKDVFSLPIITTEATEKICEKTVSDAILLNIDSVAPLSPKKIDEEKLTKLITDNCSCSKQARLDRFFTSKATGIPVMILLLACVLYITIIGANYPSEFLSYIFGEFGVVIRDFFTNIELPQWLVSLLCDGMYRTVTWVVSVMLPPMAIFFPIFALLENFGYLPRVAFNLDNIFSKANCSGKQALTMCMGFGCNACGVTGCRIINDKSQRLNAIVTNNFIPCNGRFPTLIALITIFMTSLFDTVFKSMVSALILTGFIVLSIMVSMGISYLLSKTVLKKDREKSYVMEMPKFKKPPILQTIYESIKNRAVFILLRALSVALPAGALIWVCANITIGDSTILNHIVTFLNPVGEIFGLDGEILIGLLLGFPANEIVFPIILMAYSGSSVMVDYSSINELGNLLIQNGWTIKTAFCMIIIVLMHFPCSTTCITIYKETKSIWWTLFSIILPTVTGLLFCLIINFIW